MSAPTITTAPSRRGFSALKNAAALLAVMKDRKRGPKLLGHAVERIIFEETGIGVWEECSAAEASQITEYAAVLRSVFGIKKTETVSETVSEKSEMISENGAEISENISENRSEISENISDISESPSLEEKEKRRENNSFSSLSSTEETREGWFANPTKMEWDAFASFRKIPSEISEDCWEKFRNKGSENVKYWRKYLTAFQNNSEKSSRVSASKSEKYARFSGAFGNGGVK